MLNSLTLLRAMNGIHEEDVAMAEKEYFMNKRNKNIRRTIHITLLAAVLVSLFTVGASCLHNCLQVCT
ncbi:MAG: hypothetical protein IJU95_08525 [Treponema sp.]|nr:hypothetical protein [Treponema sp.]